MAWLFQSCLFGEKIITLKNGGALNDFEIISAAY